MSRHPLSPVLAFALLIVLTGCGGAQDPEPPVVDAQLEVVQGQSEVASPATEATDKPRAAVISAVKRRATPLSEADIWPGTPKSLAEVQVQIVPLEKKKDKTGYRVRIELAGEVAIAAACNIPREVELDGQKIESQLLSNTQQQAYVQQARDAMRVQGWLPVITLAHNMNGMLTPTTIFHRRLEAGDDLNFESPMYAMPHLVILTDAQARTLAALPLESTAPPFFAVTPRYFTEPERSYKIAAPADSQTLTLALNDPHDLVLVAPGLTRELVRQALLITAREEFGLTTRDACLRETWNADSSSTSLPLEVSVSRLRDFRYQAITLYQRHPERDVPVWQRTIRLTQPFQLEQLTTWCEEWSRTEFVQVLQQQGWQKQERQVESSPDLPADLEHQLRDFNPIAQFFLIRTLHQDLRQHGETPERLHALSRAYAHLATLTDYLHSPAFRASQARALLYAERALQQQPNDLTSRWHRAYVRGVLGRHLAAIEDLQIIHETELFAESQGASVSAPPRWSQMLEDLCYTRRAPLEAAELDPEQESLAAYFQLLAWPFAGQDEREWHVCERILARSPDCLRCYRQLLYCSPLGIQREFSRQPLAITARSVATRLSELPDVPENIRNYCRDFTDDSSLSATAKLLSHEGELQRLLREAANADTSQEFSWTALADLLNELTFDATLIQLTFLRQSLGIPVEDQLENLQPIVAGHRFAVYLHSFENQPSNFDAEFQKLLERVPAAELEVTCHQVLSWLKSAYPGNVRMRNLLEYSGRHRTNLYSEIAGNVLATSSTYKPWDLVEDLRESSPYSCLTRFADMQLQPKKVPDFLRDWETTYADEAVMQRSLGEWYYEHAQWADTERCLVRAVELDANLSAYQWLAAAYFYQGNHEGWKQILEEALQEESFGLERTQIHVSLADGLLMQKQWDEARVHAHAAAASGAAWGVLCAARYHEALEEWAQAEELVRSTAERYESNSFGWYFWCRRTGRGNLREAESHAERFLKSLPRPIPQDYSARAVAFLVLTSRRDQALLLIEEHEKYHHAPQLCALAALLEDLAGNSPNSLQYWHQALRPTFNEDDRDWSAPAVNSLANYLAGKSYLPQGRPLSQATVEGLYKDCKFQEKTFINYLMGRYFWNRNNRQEAEILLRRAATSGVDCTARTFAAAFLREQNLEVGPIRGEE